MQRTIISLAVILLVALVVWNVIPARAPVLQPIQYNHNVHIEGEELECIDCHESVEESPRATIPVREVCEDCHDTEPLSESPEEEVLIAHIESGLEIAWNRIYSVPNHVYFSHRRHVTLGEIECTACHGDVAEQTVPAVAPVVPLTMEWCMDCHAENQVSNDCLACHR
jgi:hypothetical protein